MKTIVIALCLLGVLLCPVVQAEEGNNDSTWADLQKKAYSLYETMKIEEGDYSYSVDVEYPKITDPRFTAAVRKKVNEDIKNYVYGLFKEELEEYKKSDVTEEEWKERFWKNYVSIEFKVERLDSRIISILFRKYIYGGGVHGMHFKYGFNYLIEESRMVKVGDLFIKDSDYLQQISDYCVVELDKKFKGPNDIWSGKVSIPENTNEFTIDSYGFVFYFAPYEIASYASGDHEVRIPYDVLKGLRVDLLEVD